MNHADTPLTVYMQYTANNGQSHVFEHRVWDKEKFIAAKAEEAALERDKIKDDGTRKANARQISDVEYAKLRARART